MAKHDSQSATLNNFGPGAQAVFHITLGLFALLCIVPFLFVIIISFTSEESIRAIGYSFTPQSWSLQAYEYVFAMGDALWRSYYNSFLITVIGTVASVDICVLYSYPLFRRDFKYRNFFNYFSFNHWFIFFNVNSFWLFTFFLFLKYYITKFFKLF